MQLALFFALFIAALAVLFALQNSATVEVSFLLWKGQSSLALVLLIALAAGALISSLLSMPSGIRARWALRQQRKKMTELETSLADTRRQLEEAQKKNLPAAPALPASTGTQVPLPGSTDVVEFEETDEEDR